MGRLSIAEQRRAMIAGLSYEQQLVVVVNYLREHHLLRNWYPDSVARGYEAGRDRNKSGRKQQETRPCTQPQS